MILDLANPTRFMALSRRGCCRGSRALAALRPRGRPLPRLVRRRRPTTSRARPCGSCIVHVPAAWLALFFYIMMAVVGARHPGLAPSARRRRRRRRGADRRRLHLLCLVTGSLWGKPMWGTWWVWDARLTSMLVLFLMYLGIIALWRAVDEPARAARAARSSPSSAPSTCRSSSSRSTGGTPCTSRPRCSASAARPSTRRSDAAARHGAGLHAALLALHLRPCAPRSCAAACAP